MRLWIAAAAAVLISSAPFAFLGTGPADQPTEGVAGAAAFEDFPSADVPYSPEETTEVLDVEDAGTTPMHDEAYRLARVTLVHRTWDVAVGNSSERMLSERTSQSDLAVPIEIF